MTGDQQRIEDYARAFEDHMVSSALERASRRAELVEHLSEAADEGQLAQALERLGSPQQAAATFAPERSLPLAAVGDRLLAASVDNLPLLVVTIALVVAQVLRAASAGTGEVTVTAVFPPVVSAQFGGVCVSLTPFVCGVYDGGLLYAIGVPLALAWSIVGLGVLEARTGTTPGKRARGLRVVTEEGLRIGVRTGIVRRLSFLVGPLAWLDWIPALWGDRHRVVDRLTGTKVIAGAHGPNADADRLPSSRTHRSAR